MSDRTAELERFYAARSMQLRRAVAASVTTTDETVLEDACQHAWATLVRRADVTLDERGAAWLATVAIREGWRLARPRRDVPSGAIRGLDPDPLELPEPPAFDTDTECSALDRIEHRGQLLAVRTLAPAQRRVVVLQALGFGYAEIAEDLQVTAAAVNGHLSRARRKLQRWERAAGNARSRSRS